MNVFDGMPKANEPVIVLTRDEIALIVLVELIRKSKGLVEAPNATARDAYDYADAMIKFSQIRP